VRLGGEVRRVAALGVCPAAGRESPKRATGAPVKGRQRALTMKMPRLLPLAMAS